RGRHLGRDGRLVEVHAKRKGRVTRKLFGPAHDELLGVVIQILLVKGRRVQRVEDLVELRDVEFDDLIARRDLVSGVRLVGHRFRTGLNGRMVCSKIPASLAANASIQLPEFAPALRRPRAAAAVSPAGPEALGRALSARSRRRGCPNRSVQAPKLAVGPRHTISSTSRKRGASARSVARSLKSSASSRRSPRVSCGKASMWPKRFTRRAAPTLPI